MKRKFLSILAAFAVLVSFSACQVGDTGQAPPLIDSVTTVVEETAEPIEMKTIEPPEDGWTVEQLNEVMYLNGKPFKLPCTLEELGEDFTIDNLVEHNNHPFIGEGENFDYIGATLFYKNSVIGYVKLKNDENNTVFWIDFIYSSSQESDMNFFVNGVTKHSNRLDIEKNLGNQFSISEINGNYSYVINDTTAISIVFNRKSEDISIITDDISILGYYCY